MVDQKFVTGFIVGALVLLASGATLAVSQADSINGILHITIQAPNGTILSDTYAGNNTTIIIDSNNTITTEDPTPLPSESGSDNSTSSSDSSSDGSTEYRIITYAAPTMTPTVTPSPTPTPLPAAGHLELSASGGQSGPGSVSVTLVNTGGVTLHPLWMSVSSGLPGHGQCDVFNQRDATCFGKVAPGSTMGMWSGITASGNSVRPASTYTVTVMVDEIGTVSASITVPGYSWTSPTPTPSPVVPPISNGS